MLQIGWLIAFDNEYVLNLNAMCMLEKSNDCFVVIRTL